MLAFYLKQLEVLFYHFNILSRAAKSTLLDIHTAEGDTWKIVQFREEEWDKEAWANPEPEEFQSIYNDKTHSINRNDTIKQWKKDMAWQSMKRNLI